MGTWQWGMHYAGWKERKVLVALFCIVWLQNSDMTPKQASLIAWFSIHSTSSILPPPDCQVWQHHLRILKQVDARKCHDLLNGGKKCACAHLIGVCMCVWVCG